MTSKTECYHVPNLERALAVLELLSVHTDGMGLSDIAVRLDFPKNSVYRIVSTLHAHGYVLRDELTKRYGLSRKLLSLGYAALGEVNLVESALETMRLLRDATGETSLIGVLSAGEGIVLEQVASRAPLKFLVDPGTRFPLHTSAPGKALLAWLPQEQCDAVLARIPLTRYTPRTITDLPAFRKELAATRARGFSLDHAEEMDGLHCLGAPILNHVGYPIAALWVTGPSFRLTSERFVEVGMLVATHADALSRRYGYVRQHTNAKSLQEEIV